MGVCPQVLRGGEASWQAPCSCACPAAPRGCQQPGLATLCTRSPRSLCGFSFASQFDVLWNELTGAEHMHLFGRIKGLPPAQLAVEARSLLASVKLSGAAKMRTVAYSGGMKASGRLATGIWLVGGACWRRPCWAARQACRRPSLLRVHGCTGSKQRVHCCSCLCEAPATADLMMWLRLFSL